MVVRMLRIPGYGEVYEAVGRQQRYRHTGRPPRGRGRGRKVASGEGPSENPVPTRGTPHLRGTLTRDGNNPVRGTRFAAGHRGKPDKTPTGNTKGKTHN
jgi:hypothetical protein